MARTTVAMIGRQIENKLSGLNGGASTLTLSTESLEGLNASMTSLSEAMTSLTSAANALSAIKTGVPSFTIYVDGQNRSTSTVQEEPLRTLLTNLIRATAHCPQGKGASSDLSVPIKTIEDMLGKTDVTGSLPLEEYEIDYIRKWCGYIMTKLDATMDSEPDWYTLRDYGLTLCARMLDPQIQLGSLES